MSEKEKDVSRRGFLSESGRNFGNFFSRTPLGRVIDAGMGSSGANTPVTGTTESADLIRTGEPVNLRGEPFGGPVTCFELIPWGIESDPCVFAVFGHQADPRGSDPSSTEFDKKLAAQRTGISVLELTRASGSWSHQVRGTGNLRWDASAVVPIEGVFEDSPKDSVIGQINGVASISCMARTPWGTVLCAEERTDESLNESGDLPRFGWIVEVNPATGLAVKRYCLGRVNAVSIQPIFEPGQPAVIYMVGWVPNQDGELVRLFKFVSEDVLQPRNMQANRGILREGTLWVIDPVRGIWLPIPYGDLKAPHRSAVAPMASDASREETLQRIKSRFTPQERPEVPVRLSLTQASLETRVLISSAR